MNWLCASLALIFIAAAPHAAAQQRMFSVAQHSEMVGANAVADVFVQCPANMGAYSGGMDTESPDAIDMMSSAPTFDGATQTPLYNVADGSHPTPTGWHVAARNHSAVAHAVAVSAICAPTFTSVVTLVTSFDLPAGTPANPGFGGVKFPCAAPAVAVGGGIDTQFPATMIISDISPLVGNAYLGDLAIGQNGPPSGWAGFVRNEGPAGRAKIAVVCYDLGGVITVNSAPFGATAGTTASGSVACPAGYAVISGGFDTQNVQLQGGAYSSPVYAADPQFPVLRPDGIYPGPAGWTASVRNNSANSKAMNVGVVCASGNSILDSSLFATVYEFYNTNLKHYFRTASTAEAIGIDGGAAGPGWVRTGDDFVAYPSGGDRPGFDVCRFYTFGANSHFFTVEVPECIALQNPSSGWEFEGFAFRIGKPGSGVCPVGTVAVHRLYNNRFAFTDSNHRFTTIFANVAAMQALGWQYEGVAFCAAAN